MTPGLKRGCRFIVITFFLLLALAAAAAFWLWQGHRGFADAPMGGVSAESTLEVASGDAFPTVLRKLREQGVSSGTDLQWRLLARHLDAAGKLKVGEYALAPELSPRELLQRMREGRVIQYRVTLVEGWNIRQVRAALASAEQLKPETAGLGNEALMEALGRPGVHPEGRFFPDSYTYAKGSSDLALLRRAMVAMDKKLDAAWAQRAPDVQIKTPEEALILASIIDKETGRASDRGQISGVFHNRLRTGMLLQTDPTVIYGLGEGFDGNLRRRDLQADTPWNTYTRAGLPPTPIAMPGKAALLAAVQPAQTRALYFVAKGDGSSHFSPSLDEHNRAVNQYQRGK